VFTICTPSEPVAYRRFMTFSKSANKV
jgi:hypothetical protein